MNQNQGISPYCSPDLLMKRKRGRPRKDENVVHGESMPAVAVPDNQKKNKMSADDGEDEMVGRVVSGVIEDSFDAGYLLNVKVENTDTQLRGVVFLPGKFSPVTAANDVAPNVKMCKRTELPIPAVNVQSEQSNKHPVEVKQKLPTVSDQTPPRIPQSGIAESLRSRSFPGFPESSSFVIPHVDNFPKSVAPTLDGKAIQQQALEPIHDQQSTLVPIKSDNDKVVEQEKVLSEVEQPATITEPTGAEDDKESKTEKATEPTVDVPSIETVIKGPPVQPQDDVKSLDFELNHTPLFAAECAPAMATVPSAETVCKTPQTVATEKVQLLDVEVKSAIAEFAKTAPVSVIPGAETVCKDAQIQPDDVVSEKSTLPQDVNSEKSASIQDAVKNVDFEINKTTLATEPVFAASKPVDKNPTEEAAPKPSLVLKEESVASLGSIPSDTMECDTVYAIPTAQS